LGGIILAGLSGLVDGEHSFDTFAEDARFESLYVVILEYAVHGKIVATGVPYDNRLISVVTIENRKIVHWRDYMDSLAPWLAMNGGR
jgi:hypothetical protein